MGSGDSSKDGKGLRETLQQSVLSLFSLSDPDLP